MVAADMDAANAKIDAGAFVPLIPLIIQALGSESLPYKAHDRQIRSLSDSGPASGQDILTMFPGLSLRVQVFLRAPKLRQDKSILIAFPGTICGARDGRFFRT